LSIGEISEIVLAHGHENIQATHGTTLEFTKDENLSRMGDCIIAVGADKALADLSDEFKEKLRHPNARLTITIEADGITEHIHACGSPNLLLTHQSDMVVRKSHHVDRRTLVVTADKAANDLSRKLVEKMQNPLQNAKITLAVKVSDDVCI
jgi:hypothetical protein